MYFWERYFIFKFSLLHECQISWYMDFGIIYFDFMGGGGKFRISWKTMISYERFGDYDKMPTFVLCSQ